MLKKMQYRIRKAVEVLNELSEDLVRLREDEASDVCATCASSLEDIITNAREQVDEEEDA
jgi:transposase